jgi:protein involved in polysaccharide export with SLBB domain
MNWLRNTVAPVVYSGAAMLGLFLSCGCVTTDTPSSNGAAPPHATPGKSSPIPASNTGGGPGSPDLLRAGDAVSIVFSGVEHPPDKFDGRIRDDGKILLSMLPQPVQASGRTAAQLQDAIHDLYVPDYFNRLTVNVNTEGRYFVVEGEVKQANRYVYSGPTTVLQAIATANGFTDFAKRTQVQVIRVTGKSEIVNCNKAKRNPKLDLPIYAGDLIVVPRRYF